MSNVESSPTIMSRANPPPKNNQKRCDITFFDLVISLSSFRPRKLLSYFDWCVFFKATAVKMPSNIINAQWQMTRNKPKLPMKMRFCHVNTLIIRTATFNSGNLRNWLVLLSEIFTLYSSCLAVAQDLSSNIHYKSTNDPKQTQLPMKIRFCHVNTLIIRTVVFNSGNLRN